MSAPWRAGDFIVRQRLGAGGMGEVWLGEHVARGSQVAIKCAETGTDRARADFEREVAAVAALRHAAVVRILDFEVGERSWFAMELARLGSAADRPPPDWTGTRTLLWSVLDALAHAHARGLVHLDLKPANVLAVGVEGAFAWKLADFGLAHALTTAQSREGVPIRGTPAYMAPEQVMGDVGSFGPPTDLYALGCMAWELVSGRPPFDSPIVSQVLGMHLGAPLGEWKPRFAVPRRAERWIRMLLCKHPHQRFQTAADAAWALHQVGTATNGDAATPAPARVRRSEPTLDFLSQDLPGPEVAAEECPEAQVEAPVDPVPIPADWRPGGERCGLSALDPLASRSVRLYRLRSLPLVGHEAARDELWSALRGDLPSARAVWGAPGLGRTALLRWLCERVHETGAAHPILVHGDDPRWLDALAAQLASRWTRADLGLGPEDQDRLADWVEGRPPTGLRLRLGLIARALDGLSRTRRVLVAIDDAPAEVLELIRTIRTRTPTARVLVVRVGDGDPTCRLEPLGWEAMRTLVDRCIDLEAALAVRVCERSAGNPGFAVEQIGTWVAAGALQAGPSGLRLDERWVRAPVTADPDDSIPRGMLLAVALGPVVRRAEWEAAAERLGGCGRFEAWVGGLGPLALDVDQKTARFVDPRVRERQIVQARSRAEWPEILRAAAQAVSDRWIAGALSIDAGDVEAGAAILMELVRTHAAADPARAVAALQTVGGVEDRLGRELRVKYWRHEAVRRRRDGSHEACLAAMERARACCGDDRHLLASIAIDRFFLAGVQRGQLGVAREALAEATAVAGEDSELEGRLRECRGWLLFQEGDYPAAIDELTRAVQVYPADDRASLALCLDRLATAYQYGGADDRAAQVLEEAAAVAPPAGGSRGQILLNRAQLLTRMGQRDEARAAAESAIDVWSREDYPLLGLAYMALAGTVDGDPAEARRLIETALAGFRELQNPQFILAAEIELLIPLVQLGDFEAFDRHFQATHGWLELQGSNVFMAADLAQRAAALLDDRGHPHRAKMTQKLARALFARAARSA